MNLTPKINEAIKLASHLHRNQVRRDKNSTPYASHLVSVAMLISSVTEDEDTIIAGLMHDSLEDVPLYTYERLKEDCGEVVAEIVKHVTEPLDANKGDDEQLPWLTRKEEYLNNLRSGDEKSAIVSAADKIHNTESFVEELVREGSDFLVRFDSSIRNRVWFHEQVLEIVTEKLGGDNALVKRLALSVDDFRKFIPLQQSIEQVSA